MPSLPPHVVGGLPKVGPLGSAGITLLHRYCRPIRHPSAFSPFPSISGYRTYLSPAISRRGGEGFSSCSVCPCCHAAVITPLKWSNRFSQFSVIHAAFTLRLRARPSGLRTFGATSTFAFAAAWQLVIIPEMILLMGFRMSVSLYPAILTTWLLTLAMAGLAPAEHTSLRWTHNRTFSFPEYGFPIIFFHRFSQCSPA